MGRIFLKKLERSVAVVEQSGLLLGSTAFWRCMTVPQECKGGPGLAKRRQEWFEDSLESLKDCDIVFADPDNGFRERGKFKPTQCKSGKSICEEEAYSLAEGGRPVVVYHHNAMFPGGHCAEVRHWQSRLGKGTCAVRWRPVSPRTFFILHCTDELRRRAEEWCQQWELPKHVYFQGYAVELDEPG